MYCQKWLGLPRQLKTHLAFSMFSVPGTAKKIVPKYRKLHTTYLISEDSEEEYYDDYAEEEGTKNYKV